MNKVYAVALLALAPPALELFLSIFNISIRVTELPSYFDGVVNYFIPAFYSLQTIPVVGTLITVLSLVLTFELVYWAVRFVLRLLEWSGFAGKPFLD